MQIKLSGVTIIVLASAILTSDVKAPGVDAKILKTRSDGRQFPVKKTSNRKSSAVVELKPE